MKIKVVKKGTPGAYKMKFAKNGERGMFKFVTPKTSMPKMKHKVNRKNVA